MLSTDLPERPGSRKPGRLSKALTGLWMKRGTIVATERLAANFRLITLEGPALRSVAWTPGQKVQIAMGSAFVSRTYTPIEWNASAGRTCILGYVHGASPGSAWVRDVKAGDECEIFGPRASLDLSRLPGPLAIFGDETSIGLAYAATHHDRTRPVICHFEMGNVETAGLVTSSLSLHDAIVFARSPDDAHIPAMEATLPSLVAAGASFVLTGRASTIQRLRQSLKREAVPVARIVTKAYWAPGKTGLD